MPKGDLFQASFLGYPKKSSTGEKAQVSSIQNPALVIVEATSGDPKSRIPMADVGHAGDD